MPLCTGLTPESMNQTVELEWSVLLPAKAGDLSSAVGFNIAE